MEERLCLECELPIRGRTDKRFCDDACRNIYNNRRNGQQNSMTRNINAILRKNRKLLQTKLGNEKILKLPKDLLVNEGFNFKFHTHVLQTNKGHAYKFVYEYGFLVLENNLILLVKNNDKL